MNSILFVIYYTERQGGEEGECCSRSLFTPLSLSRYHHWYQGRGGGSSIQFRVGVIAVETALLSEGG